jgi:hypothetical protein
MQTLLVTMIARVEAASVEMTESQVAAAAAAIIHLMAGGAKTHTSNLKACPAEQQQESYTSVGSESCG